MIVDHQTHWYPPAYFSFVSDRAEPPRARRVREGWHYEPRAGVEHVFADERLSLDAHLAGLDAAGVTTMVSSPALLGDVAHLEPSLAAELTALLNEQAASAQREHPGRFVGLAMVPMTDAPAAVKGLERARADGLNAFCVLANLDGGSIATPETRAVYRAADELGLTLFLHPAERSTAVATTPYRPIEVGVNWLWDTSVAALSLIYSGTLDACPGLTVVHPHLGGTLPFLIGRLAGYEEIDPGSSGAAHPVTHYLRERFYADSLNLTPGALRLGVDLYGEDRVLFASDTPFFDRRRALQLVRDGLEPDLAERVLHRNRVPGVA